MTDPVYDFLGVGFGPANLALSVALDNRDLSLTGRYFEQRDSFAWQPDMMLRGSDIQHHPLRDLITPVNPRSKYGFVSYLHQSGRYFEYLNVGSALPLRLEFANYVQWVARHFSSNVDFGSQIASVEVATYPGQGNLAEIHSTDGSVHLARNVVIGPGRAWNIPEVFEPLIGDRVFHLTEYLPRIKALKLPERIAVVGASQSAVEILLDLDTRFPKARIESITRKFGFALKDTSPFTGEVYFPEFTDYYYNASAESRMALAAELRGTNYASADRDVIDKLYLRRYESGLEGFREHLTIRRSKAIRRARLVAGGVELEMHDLHDHKCHVDTYDVVVLATGFLDFGTGGQRRPSHPLLAKLERQYAFDARRGFNVARDYALMGDLNMPGIYLNGLCEHSHGFGDAGSFSLLSLRADEIARSLAERLGRQACTRESPNLVYIAEATAI